MKKYLFFGIIAGLLLSQNSKAQLTVPKLPLQKKVATPVKFTAIKHAEDMIQPAEKKIVFAHVDLLQPTVLSLKTSEFINKAKANCLSLKDWKATITLEAKRTNNSTADLNWETKYAFNASGFNIQRSQGDTLHFATINFTVASLKTNFKKNYHIPDYNDYSNISFYRVKQVNKDATYNYSNTVAIKGYEVVSLRIYPNPVISENKIQIDFTPKLSGNASVLVYNGSGKILRQYSIDCIESQLTVQSLDVSHFVAGVYMVKILMPDKSFLTRKFVKQ